MITKLFPGKTYVIHAEEGYEYHEKRLIELFNKFNLNFEFVLDGSPSNFSKELLDQYFTPNILNKYSKGGISCTLNHFFAFDRLIQSGEPYGLIFENDPFFLGDFNTKLEKLLPEIKNLEPGFIISLENTTLTFPSYQQTQKGRLLYRANRGRMAGAYLIDLQGAKSAIEYLKSNKCDFIIDWFHNELINNDIIKMYWAHPPLVEQGSHNGFLSSTISSKKKSTKRRIAWIARKMVKQNLGRLGKQRRIID